MKIICMVHYSLQTFQQYPSGITASSVLRNLAAMVSDSEGHSRRDPGSGAGPTGPGQARPNGVYVLGCVQPVWSIE